MPILRVITVLLELNGKGGKYFYVRVNSFEGVSGKYCL